MKKIVLFLIFAVSFAAQAQDYGKKFSDLNYAGDDQGYHTLDVYLPKTREAPYPVVIHIYGSAWFSNDSKDKADINTIVKALLDAGFAVVTPNHRSSMDAKFPAQINDIKAVVRFVRGKAAELGLDQSFIGISGCSSGGHLAALTGTTNGVKEFRSGNEVVDIEGNLGQFINESSRVNAVCDWFGPVDILNIDSCRTQSMFSAEQSPETALMGYPVKDNIIRSLSASAITYVDPSDPPFLLIHGDKDALVPYCQSKDLNAALKKAGVKSEYIQVAGGEHYIGTVTDANIDKMVGFFREEKNRGRSFTLTGNPMITDKFTADPAPMVYDGRLYLYVGHDEYYPGQDSASGGKEFNITEWLCYSTKDMKTWTDHGSVLKPTDFNYGVGEAWASQVVEKDGKFYYYTTMQAGEPYNSKVIGVAVSDSPTGPFVDPLGKPLITDDMTSNGPRGWWNDIDPTVFIDDDGTPWMCWGNGTCFLVKLKPDMITLDGEIEVLEMPRYVEGPWLHKHGNLYYLTYASMGQGRERIDYATAPSMEGPWTPRGVLTGMAENSFTIHPGIIEFKEQSYLFYHNATLTLNDQSGAIGRRSVCIDYLHYLPDGSLAYVEQTKEGIGN
jgi:acetyl esterase/lipase